MLLDKLGDQTKVNEAMDFMKNKLHLSTFAYFRAEDYVHSYLTATKQLMENGGRLDNKLTHNSLLMQPSYTSMNTGNHLGVEKMDEVFQFLPLYTQGLRDNFDSNFVIGESRDENSMNNIGNEFKNTTEENFMSSFVFAHGNPLYMMLTQEAYNQAPNKKYTQLDNIVHDISDGDLIRAKSYYMDPNGYTTNLCACANNGSMQRYRSTQDPTYARVEAQNTPANSFVRSARSLTKLAFGLEANEQGLPLVVLNKQSTMQGELK